MSATFFFSSVLGIFVLACCAELASRCFSRRPALCHALWLAVLVRSLVPSIPLIPAGIGETSSAGLPLLFLTESTELSSISGVGILGLSLVDGLLILWGIGSVCFLTRSVARSLSLRKCIRLGQPADARLKAEVSRGARTLGIGAPRVVTLASIRAPFVYGLRDPILVWPESDTSGASRARSSIILHELVHLKRRDTWTSWIEVLAVCLWWWNPVVRYAIAQSRRFKELACDAWVMEQQPEGRHAYANALIDAIRIRAARPMPDELLNWMGSGARVKERLRSLYRTRQIGKLNLHGFVLMLALFAISLPGLSFTSAPPDQLVSSEITDSQRAFLDRFDATSFEQLQRRSEQQIALNANNGQAHYEFAIARSFFNDFRGAIESFQRQYDLKHSPTYASYNIACCYSRLGELDDAIHWLRKSVESGYNSPLQIDQDQDFDNLRTDSRFRALIDELLAQR